MLRKSFCCIRPSSRSPIHSLRTKTIHTLVWYPAWKCSEPRTAQWSSWETHLATSVSMTSSSRSKWSHCMMSSLARIRSPASTSPKTATTSSLATKRVHSCCGIAPNLRWPTWWKMWLRMTRVSLLRLRFSLQPRTEWSTSWQLRSLAEFAQAD